MGELDLIFNNENEAQDVKLLYKGVEFNLKVRELSWSERSTILSKSMVYDKDGTMSLNYLSYMRETLKKIIVSAPWGKTDDIFLSKINSSFGSVLESLVPKSFTEPDVASFFGKEQQT